MRKRERSVRGVWANSEYMADVFVGDE